MTIQSKHELVSAVRVRYQKADRRGKCRILDELVANTEYHRKYAIQLLNRAPKERKPSVRRNPPQQIYGGCRSSSGAGVASAEAAVSAR